MKKSILFFYLFSFLAFFGYSQSLSLSNASGPIEPNSTIVQAGTPDSTELVTYLNVINSGDRAVRIVCKKTELSLMEDTEVTFCFGGICYFYTTYVSDPSDPIEPGGSITDFSGHYNRSDWEPIPSGETVVRWTFFVNGDENDSVSVTVKYTTYPLGIEKPIAFQGFLSSGFPNPANEIVTFHYQVATGSQGTLIIRNLVGSALMDVVLPATEGKITLPTAGLPGGIYFCSLMVEGKMVGAQKILVVH